MYNRSSESDKGREDERRDREIEERRKQDKFDDVRKKLEKEEISLKRKNS